VEGSGLTGRAAQVAIVWVFHPAGIFIGDGSYLFVPEHEAYEGSA